MDRAEEDRLIYDYGRKSKATAELRSIDHTLFYTWNKKLRKWTLRQKVNGRLHIVGHYNSEAEGVRAARKMKWVKNTHRLSELESNSKWHEEREEFERKEVISGLVDEETERAFYDSGIQQAKTVISLGG